MAPRCSLKLTVSAVPLVILLTAVFQDSSARAQDGVGYMSRIDTAADFETVSIPESHLPGVDRIAKFLAPAREDPGLLPPIFQNVAVYPKHQEFLAAEFPDRFPGLGGEEYLALVERRATRSYFAGTIFRFQRDTGAAYGFDVFTLSGDRDELPLPDEILWIFRQLTPVFGVGVLSYAPQSPSAIENAREWADTEFAIDFAFSQLGDTTYLPYTIASNYGRVRVFTGEAFARANETGSFGSQDIVVVNEAPADIEGVIAGVITGSIQSELGHLAIRTARRGTPNAFVRGATAEFAPHDGKLVFLEVGVDGFRITSDVTLADAEAWWAAHQPDLGSPAEIDASYRELDAMPDIPTDGSVDLVTRYGGKGGNFARLFHLLPEEHRVPGFVVPFSYYLEFIDTNQTPSRADPERLVSLRDYIDELLEEPEFRSDSARRFEELETLRDLFEDAVVDPEVVSRIALRVLDVFGTGENKVRFRSSSNAEDQLEFNGAGLYRSVGGCIADDLDADSEGPSHCDPNDSSEDGVAKSLKTVWASLWNFRAFEEREYFQIPHREVGMAVLVSEAFPDELANGVSFTGNPTIRGDRRFLVNAQLGDTAVVFTDPGVIAEKTLLEMADGQVVNIIRVRPSSLVPPGTLVLSDDNLRELGALMALVERSYAIDLGGFEPDDVLLDFEFKLDRRTGRIRLKQVRPFLIPDTGRAPAPEFQLEVPAGITACGSFLFPEGQPNVDVLRSKARLGLKAGVSTVRSDGTSAADLFQWLELEAGGPRYTPKGPGLWTPAERVQSPAGFRYSMHQDFDVGGEIVRVALRGLFVADDGSREIVLDSPALTWATGQYFLRLEYGRVSPAAKGDAPIDTTWFLPCDLIHLPRFEIDVAFGSGDRVHFEEHFQELTVGTGPAELVHATVKLGGQEQLVEDYWRLVYSAGHHNDTPFPERWAILDPPIDVAGVGTVKVVVVAQNHQGDEPTAALLGEDLEVLRRPDIVLFRRKPFGAEEVPQFRRGDSNASGSVEIGDAIGLLLHLFQQRPLECPDAADFDDFGTLDIGDAIFLLHFLFFNLDPPAAPGPHRCGEDVMPDDLPACEGAGCL